MKMNKEMFDFTTHPECEHFGLVVHLAKKFIQRNKNLSFGDLLSIGYLALKNAWDGYVEEEGVPFGSYAVVAIRNSFKQALNNSHDFHMPIGVACQSWMVQQGHAKLDETDKNLGIAIMVRNLQKQGFDYNESLQSPPDDLFIDKDSIYYALSHLTERERTIITMRFGLKGDGPNTLDAIGEHLGLSKERVRQLQSEAIEKMKLALKEEGV